VKQAIIVHLQMLKRQRTQENISALREAFAQKEVALLLPVPQAPIPLVSVLRLPPIALLAHQDKFVVEVVHNQVQLFVMLATIVPWELKIALWLSMFVIWDMSALLDLLIKQNANLGIISH